MKGISLAFVVLFGFGYGIFSMLLVMDMAYMVMAIGCLDVCC
jgi:hypothetical protein